jgi:hypothetical protein
MKVGLKDATYPTERLLWFLPTLFGLRANNPPSTKGFKKFINSGVQAQWLVPSDNLVLFQTLYLPTARFIGKRLISFRVCAS